MIYINNEFVDIIFENKYDKLHRLNGPAFIDGDDYQEWYLNGNHHRIDGPAIIHGNYEVWYLNGNHHRIDGPAIIHGNYEVWYLNGIRMK